MWAWVWERVGPGPGQCSLSVSLNWPCLILGYLIHVMEHSVMDGISGLGIAKSSGGRGSWVKTALY